MPDHDEKRNPGIPDLECHFVMDGIQCPYPAPLSDTVRAGGPWWCKYHQWPGNRNFNAEQSDFMRRAQDPACRKDQMEVWYGDGRWRDEIRQQIVNANPRFLKAKGETREAYQERMQTEIRLLTRRQQMEVPDEE